MTILLPFEAECFLVITGSIVFSELAHPKITKPTTENVTNNNYSHFKVPD
jgi:hypothetical protein